MPAISEIRSPSVIMLNFLSIVFIGVCAGNIAHGAGPKRGSCAKALDRVEGKPISPNEVRPAQAARIPVEVIDVVNEMIVENWNGFSATLKQSEVAKSIADKLGITTQVVFDQHLLDFEEAFRAAGWNVEYDKPGYNESYEPTFKFTAGTRTKSRQNRKVEASAKPHQNRKVEASANSRVIPPSQMKQAQAARIPVKVIDVVNEMIVENWNGFSATLKQSEVAKSIADKLGITTQVVFDQHLLDFEEAFRAAGWNVEYDKPGYNESYEPTFKFTAASTEN